MATAILVVNNVRDIETDRRAGKNTLAVRLGRERTRKLFMVLIGAAYVVLPMTLAAEGGPWARDARRPLGAAGAARAEPGAEPDRRPGPERRARRDRAGCSASSACWSPPGSCRG